jgi:23S rRNA (cytidine1920-2'-O)/16S rRNA (cytidine1409-2'-O)-methyltransferase
MNRLDKYLVEHGFAPSRERARLAVESGLVKINGAVAAKCSTIVRTGDFVEYSNPLQFVSRGGLKLAKALQEFNIDLQGMRVLDIGSSTGGFTDCALQNGASLVFAVDVGKDQLHPALQKHDKIRSLEETDFRDLQPDQLDNVPCDIIVADVSFISLQHLLPRVNDFLTAEGKLILLIKPQFEAGPDLVGKGGIVKKPKVHEQIISRLFQAAGESGFFAESLCFAPLTKGKNIEYLVLLGRKIKALPDYKKAVESAFSNYSDLQR